MSVSDPLIKELKGNLAIEQVRLDGSLNASGFMAPFHIINTRFFFSKLSSYATSVSSHVIILFYFRKKILNFNFQYDEYCSNSVIDVSMYM